MNILKKKIILISFVIYFIFVSFLSLLPKLNTKAQVIDYITITVTELNGVNRINVPVLTGISVNYLIGEGYITSEHELGVLDSEDNHLQFTPADDELSFVIPELNANETATFILSFNDDTTEFAIIPGTGGYVEAESVLSPDTGWSLVYEGGISYDSLLVEIGWGLSLYTNSDGDLFLEYIGDDGYVADFDHNWFTWTYYPFTSEDYYYGLTFTTPSVYDNFFLQQISPRIARNGSPEGTIYAALCLIEEGYPSDILGYTGEYEFSGCTTQFRPLYFEDFILLDPETQYGVFFFVDYTFYNGSNYLLITADDAAGYTDGYSYSTANAGASWVTQSYDLGFQTQLWEIDNSLLSVEGITDNYSASLVYNDLLGQVELYINDVLEDSDLNVSDNPVEFRNGATLLDGSAYSTNIIYNRGSEPSLWYDLQSMIESEIIPDLDEIDEGLLTWGENYGIEVSLEYNEEAEGTDIDPDPYAPTIGDPNVPVEGVINPLPYLDSWYGGCGEIDELPFYQTFNEQATAMGMSTCFLYFMMMMATSSAIGLGILLFTGSAVLTIGGMLFAMSASVGTTVSPGYLVFTFIILALCIYYLSKQN